MLYSAQFRLFQNTFILLLLMLFPMISSSWNLRGSHRGVSEATAVGDEETLIGLLDRDQQANDQAYESALQHLNDMETKPTCDRTATALLITSCQAVDSSREGGIKEDDQLLALVKDVYATRLALCELQRAGTTPPSDCNSVVDFSLKGDRMVEPEILSRTYLEPCTQALYKNQQQWTSYSNNRQKASMTCHAARIDIEKNIMIQNARNLANNTANLKDAVEQTLLQHDRRIRQQEDFAKKVKAFHVRIVNELDVFSDSLKFRLGDIVAEIGRSFSQKAEHMVRAFSSSESSAALLRKALQQALSDLANIVRLHQKMSSDILNHRAETASKEKANHDLAIKTKNTLEEVNKGEIVSLISAIDSVASKTEMLSTAIHVLKSGQEELRQSLQDTNRRIEEHVLHIGIQFEAIQANATRAAEEQEAAQSSMQNLSASLKEVAATAQEAAKNLEVALPLLIFFEKFIKHPIYLVLIAILFAFFYYFRPSAHRPTKYVIRGVEDKHGEIFPTY